MIDWLYALAKQHQKRMMIRLVKGAYWDAEIKLSQIQGYHDYPVFTRKHSTDVSYIACAKKLLSHPDLFYAQFGTHNAYTVASILQSVDASSQFEFQCLYGMGRPLYDQIVEQRKYHLPCRMYAPVGTHQDLLGYLVRRLLENGANTSFINQLANDDYPIEKIIVDHTARIAALPDKSHPKIPKPKDIYHHWKNSKGIDLSHAFELSQLKKQMEQVEKTHVATSLTESDIEHCLKVASEAKQPWAMMPLDERIAIFNRAASYFERDMATFITLLNREGGKCLLDCISEVRETIDYCRYYAYRASVDLPHHELPGPTGENNQFKLYPRGIITCISPWNFPLAIFTGQIVAALVTGNVVIAKPALQTPCVAYHAVKLLHEAGVPKEVLQLLIGRGSMIGKKLISDPRIDGVMLTGSTDTAKTIEQTLANRPGPIGMFIAETGGQNAMIVDSSALIEQTVIDIAQSAFNSAGQRCSALRVLFVQEEIAPKLLAMLKGYMAELRIGDPSLLQTDIGPVIDGEALTMLKNHYEKMSRVGSLVAEVPKNHDISGYYFSPCIFEINNLNILESEVFGPILHVIRYQSQELDQVIQAIIQTGYGLTLGIHSRIDSTVQYIRDRLAVGNMYVNRNMIGAVVGVQPFGGERLSGTGPKAGGIYYLPRLCVERTLSINTTAVGGNARLVSLLEEDE